MAVNLVTCEEEFSAVGLYNSLVHRGISVTLPVPCDHWRPQDVGVSVDPIDYCPAPRQLRSSAEVLQFPRDLFGRLNGAVCFPQNQAHLCSTRDCQIQEELE